MKLSFFRIFVYLIVALGLAVFLPIEIRSFDKGPSWSAAVKSNMMIVLSCSVSLAFFMLVRLKDHARNGAAANVIMSVSISYVLLILFLLFARVDYSRTIVSLSYFACLFWFLLIHFWEQRYGVFTYVVIPGGKLDVLKPDKRTRFIQLRDSSDAIDVVNNERKLDGVIADLRFDHGEVTESVFTKLTLDGIPVIHYRKIEEDMTGQVALERFTENFHGTLLPNAEYIRLKRVLDTLLIITCLPVVLLLALVAMVLVRVSDGGPVLYRQHRVGYLGKPFTIYKFRTMSKFNDANPDQHSAETKTNDPRIIRFGHFLRKSRLDELPQLYNVVKGDMSIIGPRPEADSLSTVYRDRISLYQYRFSVRPGITGWAQVRQGHVTELDSVREKLKYDLYYIKHFSFWLDILILRKTITTVLTGFGGR